MPKKLFIATTIFFLIANNSALGCGSEFFRPSTPAPAIWRNATPAPATASVPALAPTATIPTPTTESAPTTAAATPAVVSTHARRLPTSARLSTFAVLQTRIPVLIPVAIPVQLMPARLPAPAPVRGRAPLSRSYSTPPETNADEALTLKAIAEVLFPLAVLIGANN
jgi:hypothetical protein